MKLTYRATIRTSFISYIVQSIVNNFAPLLFLTFHRTYGIPLSQITALISINFIIQLIIDAGAAVFLDRIGYRISVVAAHIFSAAGLILMTFLPDILPNPFVGLLLAVFLYATGGGLIEVIVSPVVEACPNDHKEQTMSILHSFYCWGSVGVISISTAFFSLFGIGRWRIMALLWSLLPIINAILFSQVPLADLIDEGEQAMPIRMLLKRKSFVLLAMIVLCAGASEHAVAQWASTFAEKSLGIEKSIGDLLCPAIFAVFMGIGRSLYGKYGSRIELTKAMTVSGSLCILSYLMIAAAPFRMLSVFGMALCGLSVSILWPGTYSLSSRSLSNGGSAMFALLALAGDLGCSAGPAVVGIVSEHFNDELRSGELCAMMFPIMMLICMMIYIRLEVKENDRQEG